MNAGTAYLDTWFHSCLQPAHSASPTTYLLSSPPSPSSFHLSLCPLGSFLSLVPACFKKATAGRQIFSERTPISYHTGEISEREHGRWEGKVGQAPFYKHGEGRGLCVCVTASAFLRGVSNEPETVSFTQPTNTLILQFPARQNNIKHIWYNYTFKWQCKAAPSKANYHSAALYSLHITNSKSTPSTLLCFPWLTFYNMTHNILKRVLFAWY